MECVLCGKPGNVEACTVCRRQACKDCGGACRVCGVYVCQQHGQRVREGGLVCAHCVARARNRQQRQESGGPVQPESVGAGKAPAASAGPAGGTSFQDLVGAEPLETAPARPANGGGFRDLVGSDSSGAASKPDAAGSSTSFQDLAGADDAPLPRFHVATPPVEDDSIDTSDDMGAPRRATVDEINARVLTGSTPAGTPYWVSTLFLGGVCLILMLPLHFGEGLRELSQPYWSYCIYVLAGATFVWAGAGMAKLGPPRERWLCLIGVALALLAAAGAWVYRAPGMVYG